MTQADRFMRTCIKRRFSLTTLLQVSRLVKDLREEEMERRFQSLNRILEQTGSEQEFCEMAFRTEKELGDGTGKASPAFHRK